MKVKNILNRDEVWAEPTSQLAPESVRIGLSEPLTESVSYELGSLLCHLFCSTQVVYVSF